MRYNGNIPRKPVIKIDKVQIWVDKNSHSKLSSFRSNYPLLSRRNTHSVHIHPIPVDSSPFPVDSCGFWSFLRIPVPFLRIPVDFGHSCRNHRGKVKYWQRRVATGGARDTTRLRPFGIFLIYAQIPIYLYSTFFYYFGQLK